MKRYVVVGRLGDSIRSEAIEADSALEAATKATTFEKVAAVKGCVDVDGVTIVKVTDYPDHPVLLYVLARDS